MTIGDMNLVQRPERQGDDGHGVGSHRAIQCEDVALREAAAENLRRHWARDVARTSALLGADVATAALISAAFGRFVTELPGVYGGLPVYLHSRTAFAVALVVSLVTTGAYRQGLPRKDPARILRASLLAGILLLYPALFADPAAFGTALALLASVSFVGVFAIRRLVDSVVGLVRPVVRFRTILVAQSGEQLTDRRRFDAGSERLDVIDTVVLDGASGSEMRQEIRQLATRIAELGADTVLIWGGLTEQEFGVAVDVALASGCRLVAGPSPKEHAHIEAHPVRLGGVPFSELTRPHLSAWQYGVKRAMDVIGSALLLVLLAPVMAVVAAAIKLGSPGSILFRHDRLGARGRVFKCYKFRSMRTDAEATLRSHAELHAAYVANDFKLPENQDPRITRIGRFLRRTSLDELPQLFNVIKGDMSLVGPRPIVPQELDHYAEDNGLLFLSLRPGITGAWASRGRSDLAYPGRAQVELDYVRQWSVLGDIAIMLRTIPAVLKRRGAH